MLNQHESASSKIIRYSYVDYVGIKNMIQFVLYLIINYNFNNMIITIIRFFYGR